MQHHLDCGGVRIGLSWGVGSGASSAVGARPQFTELRERGAGRRGCHPRDRRVTHRRNCATDSMPTGIGIHSAAISPRTGQISGVTLDDFYGRLSGGERVAHRQSEDAMASDATLAACAGAVIYRGVNRAKMVKLKRASNCSVTGAVKPMGYPNRPADLSRRDTLCSYGVGRVFGSPPGNDKILHGAAAVHGGDAAPETNERSLSAEKPYRATGQRRSLKGERRQQTDPPAPSRRQGTQDERHKCRTIPLVPAG